MSITKKRLNKLQIIGVKPYLLCPSSVINSARAPTPTSNTIASNTSIWQNGLTKSSSLAPANIKVASACKIGITEVSAVKRGFSQNSSSKVSVAEISPGESCLAEHSITQVSPL